MSGWTVLGVKPENAPNVGPDATLNEIRGQLDDLRRFVESRDRYPLMTAFMGALLALVAFTVGSCVLRAL